SVAMVTPVIRCGELQHIAGELLRMERASAQWPKEHSGVSGPEGTPARAGMLQLPCKPDEWRCESGIWNDECAQRNVEPVRAVAQFVPDFVAGLGQFPGRDRCREFRVTGRRQW